MKAQQTEKISDAKYIKSNFTEKSNKLKCLNSDEEIKLMKHESIFDGTLGNYICTEYKIEPSL